MTLSERDLKIAHYAAWLEEQARERREKEELRATLAAVERRLDSLERRLYSLDGRPMSETRR